MSYNIGGLSSSKLAEIEHWLTLCRQARKPIQILVPQETRWSLNSEWTTEHHHVIHSRSGSRKDGLMVLIEKSFVSSQAIRSFAVVPG